MPDMFDVVLEGGNVRPGILESATLSEELAPGQSFAATNDHNRNTAMINNTATGAALRDGYEGLRGKAPHAAEGGLLAADVPPEDAGVMPHKSQREIGHMVDDERGANVAALFMARPVDDPQAYAYACAYASARDD